MWAVTFGAFAAIFLIGLIVMIVLYATKKPKDGDCPTPTSKACPTSAACAACATCAPCPNLLPYHSPYMITSSTAMTLSVCNDMEDGYFVPLFSKSVDDSSIIFLPTTSTDKHIKYGDIIKMGTFTKSSPDQQLELGTWMPVILSSFLSVMRSPNPIDICDGSQHAVISIIMDTVYSNPDLITAQNNNAWRICDVNGGHSTPKYITVGDKITLQAVGPNIPNDGAYYMAPCASALPVDAKIPCNKQDGHLIIIKKLDASCVLNMASTSMVL